MLMGRVEERIVICCREQVEALDLARLGLLDRQCDVSRTGTITHFPYRKPKEFAIPLEPFYKAHVALSTDEVDDPLGSRPLVR